ncbi:MAG: DUF3000 family protein [Micrococcales bacterium]|nr:DUF3000 family protein [Micrococcales bacterium]
MALPVVRTIGISLEQMSFYELSDAAPAEFLLAAASLAKPYIRSELKTEQITAPDGIADWSIAFATEVPDSTETASHRGVGRLVFLHDPKHFDIWGSNMRIIAYAKSPLESEMEREEDSANYYWETLMRALAKHGAKFVSEAGTITKMSSTGMGSLAKEQSLTEIELRASWSPSEASLGSHFGAWQDLVASMAGFSIEGEAVIPLSKAQ